MFQGLIKSRHGRFEGWFKSINGRFDKVATINAS